MSTQITSYPIAGTNAERVLGFIRENPGTTTNSIITSLSMNPTVARKCLDGLIKHERVIDEPDTNGHHRWTARSIL